MMAVYHDGIKEEFYFPDNPVTESEDGQNLLERTNGYLRNSSFHDVHFFNGEMDFRGFWKTMSWTDGVRHKNMLGSSRYIDYTAHGEVVISDLFSGLNLTELQFFNANFAFNSNNLTMANTTVISLGDLLGSCIFLNLVCSNMNYYNTTDLNSYKTLSVVLETQKIQNQLNCSISSGSFNLSMRNDLQFDLKTVRFTISSQKVEFEESGHVTVIVELWDTTSSAYQMMINCEIVLNTTEISSFTKLISSSGNILYGKYPDLNVPSVFRIKFNYLYFYQGQILLKNNASRNLSLIQTASTLSSLRPPGC